MRTTELLTIDQVSYGVVGWGTSGDGPERRPVGVSLWGKRELNVDTIRSVGVRGVLRKH